MVRALTVLVWAAVAGSATFWAWRLVVPAAPSPDRPRAATPLAMPLGDLFRLLGESPLPFPVHAAPVAGERERFQLMGVIAEMALGSAGEGLALIAVDGQRARAYRVGAMLDTTWALQAVQSRGVTLATRHGDATIVIESPTWPVAAAGGHRQTSGTEFDPGSKTPVPPAAGSPSVMRPGLAATSSGQDRAPNVLLNNPADMAPADASDRAGQSRQ